MLKICRLYDKTSASKYYYVRIADGKAWLLPCTSSRLLKLALAIYQPVGLKGRGFKLLFPYLASNKGFRRLIGQYMQVLVVDVSLRAEFIEWIDEVFRVRDPILSFYMGYPNIISKSTCQVGDRELNILGYAKFSDETTGCEMIKAEAGFLERYGDNKAGIPQRLAFRTDLLGLTILAQTTIKTTQRSKEGCMLNQKHIDFLQQLLDKTRVTMNYKATDYYANQQHYMATVLSYATLEDQKVIRAAVDIINRRLGYAEVTFSVAHRDFKPFNLCFADGQIMVFDWELVAYEYPPFYNWFDFVTFGLKTSRITVEKIYTALETHIMDLENRYPDYSRDLLELYCLMYQTDTTLLTLSLNPESDAREEAALLREIIKFGSFNSFYPKPLA